MTVIIPTSQCNCRGYHLIIVVTSHEHSLLARFWVFCMYYVMGWALIVLPFTERKERLGEAQWFGVGDRADSHPSRLNLFTTTLWLQVALQKWQLRGRNTVYRMAFFSTQQETKSILSLCLPPRYFFYVSNNNNKNYLCWVFTLPVTVLSSFQVFTLLISITDQWNGTIIVPSLQMRQLRQLEIKPALVIQPADDKPRLWDWQCGPRAPSVRLSLSSCDHGATSCEIPSSSSTSLLPISSTPCR